MSEQPSLQFDTLPRKKRGVPKMEMLAATIAEMIAADDKKGRYPASDDDLPKIFFIDITAEVQIWEDLKNGK